MIPAKHAALNKFSSHTAFYMSPQAKTHAARTAAQLTRTAWTSLGLPPVEVSGPRFIGRNMRRTPTVFRASTCASSLSAEGKKRCGSICIPEDSCCTKEDCTADPNKPVCCSNTCVQCCRDEDCDAGEVCRDAQCVPAPCNIPGCKTYAASGCTCTECYTGIPVNGGTQCVSLDILI